MRNFTAFVSLPLGRFRGCFLFSFLFLTSCHDLHQKFYDTFHGKKAAKDSAAKTANTTSVIQLTPEEEMDSVTNGSIATPWENAGIEDVKGLKLFIKKLQFWSASDNGDSIAANIDYPLLNDESISSAKIFLQQYEKVFNGKVRAALQQQKLNNLFRNFQGVMIGNGELWIDNVSNNKNEVYKIRSINYDE